MANHGMNGIITIFDTSMDDFLAFKDDMDDLDFALDGSFNVKMDEWSYISELLSSFLDGSSWLVCGTVERWNGKVKGGRIVTSLKELLSCWSECEDYHIFDEDGHMRVIACHHDGRNVYEIKRLTRQGMEFAGHAVISERDLHETLWNDSTLTHLPWCAKHFNFC